MNHGKSWERTREGLGLWEHRCKVAIAGWGQSPIDRRWDGVSTDKTMGAYAMLAVQRALDDAGRDAVLASWRERLSGLETDPRLFFHPAEDYGPDQRLRPGVVPRSGFQHAVPGRTDASGPGAT